MPYAQFELVSPGINQEFYATTEPEPIPVAAALYPHQTHSF
ncbi:hypothetical protein CKA32_006415 [Geitlerinema sp. FC II]|nr:hypothetical protein CKA32_006415 [Geitlerinema sp. FC II]